MKIFIIILVFFSNVNSGLHAVESNDLSHDLGVSIILAAKQAVDKSIDIIESLKSANSVVEEWLKDNAKAHEKFIQIEMLRMPTISESVSLAGFTTEHVDVQIVSELSAYSLSPKIAWNPSALARNISIQLISRYLGGMDNKKYAVARMFICDAPMLIRREVRGDDKIVFLVDLGYYRIRVKFSKVGYYFNADKIDLYLSDGTLEHKLP